jgi:diaminohydroxyphosphoribosylaminopyrimidine deaminase/5-amino-6-(5-phosphoribosylamino)uracil reductase
VGELRARAMMERALFHAARGQGRTTPNPMVGAVVVSRDDAVVGHGWHERAGEAHAEVNALDEAGEAARGGTLFVTLEPCCHIGRTGPCTKRVIAAGITRVVAAMRDPDPRVAGKGFAELRAAGIEVVEGLFEEDARRLNQAYITVKLEGRPFVLLKAAASLDARIARSGERTKLSSPEADRKTHQLRAGVDAIAVGSETVLTDDPVLTARESYRIRPLVRVLFDRRLRTPRRARVFSTLDHGPVIILTGSSVFDARPREVAALEAAGATVAAADNLLSALTLILRWDVTTLLVEGGAALHGAFLDAGLVDRVHLIVTPHTLGGGVELFGGRDLGLSALERLTVELRGADTWIEADVHRHRRADRETG